MEYEENVLANLPSDLTDFIYKTVPSTIIRKENVEKVQLDKFQELKEFFGKQIEEIRQIRQIKTVPKKNLYLYRHVLSTS